MWVVWPPAHSTQLCTLCGELQKSLDADQKYHVFMWIDLQWRLQSEELGPSFECSQVINVSFMLTKSLCFVMLYYIVLHDIIRHV